MKVAVGGDHAGFVFKNDLVGYIRRKGFEVLDLGAHAYNEKDDHPDFAFPVARALIAGEAERGIVACGSGVGASVAANDRGAAQLVAQARGLQGRVSTRLIVSVARASE